MVTDMTHNNALITNAMLALYASENINYLKMIEPFILYSIPNELNSKIGISEISQKVYIDFGLDIKSKVVEKILFNLSNCKNDKKKENKK